MPMPRFREFFLFCPARLEKIDLPLESNFLPLVKIPEKP